MRATTCTDGVFEVVERPDPVPGPGQVVLDVHACGICGSDLHARAHADEFAATVAEVGYDGMFRSHEPVVLGHEFTGVVVEHGPRTRGLHAPGSRVVSFPLVRRDGEVQLTGLSPVADGGFAERVLVEEAMTFAVPDSLSTDLAALTEPLAVALHAVRRSGIGRRQVAVVVGCGPVGLAVIAMLKASGVRTVVASDLSPARRALASACGADVVVDAHDASPFETPASRGHLTTAAQLFDLAVGSMEKLRRVPVVPWERIWKLAEVTGATTPKHPVVFECVGAPGMIERIVSTAPFRARVVVVGVCMETDRFRPGLAINKELDLRFVLGYTPGEFHEALRWLAAGRVDVGPLLTGRVGLGGVDDAFTALAAGSHAKILVDPRSDAEAVVRIG
ncbi:zinc-binding dehydrogenase [Jatrophihabitans sp. YIM 134969]